MLRTPEEARLIRCYQISPNHGTHPFCMADKCMAWEQQEDKGYCRMVGIDTEVVSSPNKKVIKDETLEEWLKLVNQPKSDKFTVHDVFGEVDLGEIKYTGNRVDKKLGGDELRKKFIAYLGKIKNRLKETTE